MLLGLFAQHSHNTYVPERYCKASTELCLLIIFKVFCVCLILVLLILCTGDFFLSY